MAEQTVKLRSIHSSSVEEPRSSAESAVVVHEDVNSHDQDDDDDEKEHNEDVITLPQSSHSLLFTEPVLSLPFGFAVTIAIMSYFCLILALLNNLSGGSPGNIFNVPVNVVPAVRAAQYISIMVGLLMEEEIPTGLYLLRMIPKNSLQHKFPYMKFGRFVLSAVVRLVMGYTFLLNVFLVIVQADGVLDIFYDVLALQFVQQLDDIAFNLAKMDVFGRHLKEAATAKCFRAEFERSKLGRLMGMGFFLKALYFCNLILSLSGVAYISILQKSGHFQCSQITVTFGDDVWEEAVTITSNGSLERKTLVYSFFNGVYKQNGTHDGRPVYVEQRKYDNTPYNESTVIAAEIKYCGSKQAWVFTHDNIRKGSFQENSDCPWLLRSSETLGYDLMDYSGDWSVWKGIIVNGAQMSIVCDECDGDTDCNFNGVCSNGACNCHADEYFGTHCEHKVPCKTLSGGNDTWSLISFGRNEYFSVYNRPVYTYNEGLENVIQDEDQLVLIYTGSRWFGALYEGLRHMPVEFWTSVATDFHAFWDEVYDNNTVIVSDPTTSSSPIGVDFYLIGERGESYGPFGVLHPLQTPPGRGTYSCIDTNFIPAPSKNISDRMLRLKALLKP